MEALLFHPRIALKIDQPYEPVLFSGLQQFKLCGGCISQPLAQLLLNLGLGDLLPNIAMYAVRAGPSASLCNVSANQLNIFISLEISNGFR